MPSDTIKLIATGQRLKAEPGTLVEPRFADAVDATIREGARLESARGMKTAEEIELNARPDDVLEVSLDDGIVLYTTAGRFKEEFLARQAGRGKGGKLIVPRCLNVRPASRGLVSFILKSIGIVDVETAAAKSIADFITDKIESKIVGDRDALYRVADLRQVDTVGEGGLTPVQAKDFNIAKPILVFLHGTASSTQGSFADLWNAPPDNLWVQIAQQYPQENIAGFEHHTLGLSPIENAVNLLRALPQGARLHLVSHSRGGIVGELICRGQLADGRAPFAKEDLRFFEPETNRELLDLLQVIASGDLGSGSGKNPFARQRGQLIELNRLFAEKAVSVERFVRVACPARGTTLASNRLDMYLSALLNIVGYIPVLKASPVYGLIKSLLLAILKQKARPEQIPGLEAQMPRSPTTLMLNNVRGSSMAPLAVVEGDIEPRGIFKKIAMLLVDRFYGSDHDLVVNTPSMDGGATRRFGIFAKSVQGDRVNHFSYFRNDESRKAILAALQQAKPAGFAERVQVPKVIARSLPRGRQTGEVPAVFIVPGIMGSELTVGDDLVWVDKLGLLWGGFGKLAIDNEEVTAVRPLVSSYGALADFLKESHEVIPFGYDWRKSIRHAAGRLAAAVEKYLAESDQPVRFIAHSMGGLVVRAMMAAHGGVWDALCRREGSRVLMLGTPNDGSHSMVRVLVGHERLIKQLALVDLRHSKNELLALIRVFPGVLELLPRESNKAPGDRKGFYSTPVWRATQSVLGQRWQRAFTDALKRADAFWADLEQKTLDRQRVFYIAGRAPDTPIDVEIDTENGHIEVLATQEGDGRVPWDGGIPAGVQHWFVDVVHGDLANHPPSFQAIAEIIETGATQALSSNRPIARGLADRVKMPEDTVDYLPDAETLTRAALGSAGPAAAERAWLLPPVAVSVTHGDLCFVDKPVAVGHYVGDNIVSAEAALDRRLGGRLRNRHELGLYPGPIRSHDIVLDLTPGGELTGAVVVGLGDVGTLTPGALSSTVRTAVLRYVVKLIETSNISDLPKFPDNQIKLASLLIGSGAGGITVENVISAVLRGVLDANRELAGETRNIDRTVRTVEFVELYEDRAALAQHQLSEIAGHATYRDRITAGQHVNSIEGGLRRPYDLEQAGWWPRIRIKTEKNGALSFTVIAAGARVPMEITPTQQSSVEPFLKQATGSVHAADRVGRVLFELLIPPEFKHHAPENRDLVLLVDKDSARYPWELMEYPTPDGDKPLAEDASLIRQLVMAGPNSVVSTTRGEAVIIADPDLQGSKYPQLPGAAKEGQTVAGLFKTDSPWPQPAVMLKPTGVDVIRELMTRDIQILHIAAHGVVNHEVKPADDGAPSLPLTGVVIGKDHVLTAAEIMQMPSTPQLAFINCCYLGRVDGGERPQLDRPNVLAADFGVSLINRGMRAVVVAGWEVQDDAAELFAKTFYTQMLGGQTFGYAVKEARTQTRIAYPDFNTWGAYQCYGDPAFRLVSVPAASHAGRDNGKQFVSLGHAIIEIDNITERAKTAADATYLTRDLKTVVDALPDVWVTEARLQAALGKAWAELRVFPRAIKAYEAAAGSARPAATLTDLEQLANLKGRYAVELDEAGDDRTAKAYIRKAIASIKQLNKDHEESIERLNLLGSAYKRLALVFGPTTKSRVRSLDTACKVYHRANECAVRDNRGRPCAYSVINLLGLQCLFKYYAGVDRGGYKVDPQQMNDWLSKLEERHSGIELTRENFWSAITETDLRVADGLSEASLLPVAQDIAQRYADIRRYASSPRQFSSVMEHLQIMQRLLQQAPVTRLKRRRATLAKQRDELVAALDRIVRHLTA